MLIIMSAHNKLPPIHPGEILAEEFMRPLKLSQNRVARDLRVPVTRVADIVNFKRGITSDTALRLAQYFGTTAQFWMNLQTLYDLEVAEREKLELIRREVIPFSATA
jgi:antitoxin HigA-1